MGGDASAPRDVAEEAARRRTFAVISHPDAGKSTLTEALALHARRSTQAGAVHGKAGRRGVTSDWMAMERARGHLHHLRGAAVRATAARVLNLLDTPGHADFSEDTYRVLAAVDCAIMLLDSAKGLEPQTLKLFDVCRHRGVPVITFVNKWDRPGREPLELLDEIEQRIGLRPAPVNWPVGVAGDFRGLIERATGDRSPVPRGRPGGAGARPPETCRPSGRPPRRARRWRDRPGGAGAARRDRRRVDEEAFLAGTATPVLFGAALPNFGVAAPAGRGGRARPAHRPPARTRRARRVRSTAPFAGQVFKVQAGMDRAHRDRLAFVRVCSGRFERGMVADPRRDRPPVRHQVRPDGVRRDRATRGGGLSRRRDRAGQRRRR